MKAFKILLIAAILGGPALIADASRPAVVMISEIPAKTVCIKHPEANDPSAFFAKATVLMFEVYKAGSEQEVGRMAKALESDANIESAVIGPLTGDFQAITISLKNNKDKAWFVKQFKRVGLTHIKLNNNVPVSLDKF